MKLSENIVQVAGNDFHLQMYLPYNSAKVIILEKQSFLGHDYTSLTTALCWSTQLSVVTIA